MKNEQAERLLEKYLTGTCSSAERALVERWYLQEADKRIQRPLQVDDEATHAAIWEELIKRTQSPARKSTPWYRYAAAALVVLSVAAWFLFQQKATAPVDLTATLDKGPGKNTATLQIGDGPAIDLDGDRGGLVIGHSGMTYADGTTLHTEKIQDFRNSTASWSTITTPRGGVYFFLLPDSTAVWLNAASSIRFPAHFESLREVFIEGEAYFEVHKDKQPFLVRSPRQEIHVLGTHFNVSDYADEAQVRTTLLEGKVKVQAEHGNNVMLQPGQQAILSKQTLAVAPVDPEESIAWKNGEFLFSNEPLEQIMNKIARWYDVNVTYSSEAMRGKAFNGGITRFEKVSKVLHMLERTERVKFEFKNNNILVKEPESIP